MQNRAIFAVCSIIIAVTFFVTLANRSSFYKQSQVETLQCVKTYTTTEGHEDSIHSIKWVDLRSESGNIISFQCKNDVFLWIYNSPSIFAQFENGRWYSVESVGYRQEGFYPMFPIVVSTREIVP